MKTPDKHFRTQIPSKVCHTSLGYQSGNPWCGIFEAKQLPDYVWRIVVDRQHLKGPLVARSSYKQILFRVSMLDMKMQVLKCWNEK